MKKIKILWSGITGRTGQLALSSLNDESTIEIIGLSRTNKDYYSYDNLDNIKENFDIIVDFSHKDTFDQILEFAINKNKPLIVGTTHLSETQLTSLEKASHIIPIFRGGNFQFKVKEFIDDVVNYAKTHDNLKLTEIHHKNKKLPTETSQVIAKKVLNETGKTIEIETILKYDEPHNTYIVDTIICDVIGMKQLAIDVLKISSLMINQKATGLYDLDKLLKK